MSISRPPFINRAYRVPLFEWSSFAFRVIAPGTPNNAAEFIYIWMISVQSVFVSFLYGLRDGRNLRVFSADLRRSSRDRRRAETLRQK